MVVSASSDHLVASLVELFSHGLRIFLDLNAVLFELWGVHLLQLGSDAGDSVVMRASMKLWEHSKVNFLHYLVFSFAKDHSSSGSSQALVGGGGHDMGVLEGVLQLLGSHQPTDMGDIREEVGADGVGDLSEPLVLQVPWVGTEPSNKYLRLELLGSLGQSIIVDVAIWFHFVLSTLEEETGSGNLLGFSVVAMSQVASLSQVQTHQALAWLEQSCVHC